MAAHLEQVKYSMSKFGTLDTTGVRVQIGSAELADLIRGKSARRLWKVENVGCGVFASVRESTPGRWRFADAHWQYFVVLSGVFVVTENNGPAAHCAPVTV